MFRTLSATAHQVTGKCTLLVTVVLPCRIKDGKEDGVEFRGSTSSQYGCAPTGVKLICVNAMRNGYGMLISSIFNHLDLVSKVKIAD